MIPKFKEFFQFSNTELKGFFAFTVIVFLSFIIPRLVIGLKKPRVIDNQDLLSWSIRVDSVEQSPETPSIPNSGLAHDSIKKESTEAIKYFYFDPNTVDLSALNQLGFPNKTSQILINFRNKGGKFYKKEDLLKVYGVYEELYLSVEPYIRIAEAPKKNYEVKEKVENEWTTSTFEKSKEVVKINININSADSAGFTALRGIGPTYASRIIKYRNLLGGFSGTNQLTEVYGITDSLVQSFYEQLELGSTEENKWLNVNALSVYELKRHPYVQEALALGIVNYRKEHGPFKSIEDLEQLYVLDSVTLQKITPYLTLE